MTTIVHVIISTHMYTVTACSRPVTVQCVLYTQQAGRAYMTWSFHLLWQYGAPLYSSLTCSICVPCSEVGRLAALYCRRVCAQCLSEREACRPRNPLSRGMRQSITYLGHTPAATSDTKRLPDADLSFMTHSRTAFYIQFFHKILR